MLQWDLRDKRVTQLTTFEGNLKIVKIQNFNKLVSRNLKQGTRREA